MSKFLFLFLFPLVCYSQVRELDEVVFSTEKVDKKISNTTNSLKVITKEQIENSGAISLEDALLKIGGNVITRNGSFGSVSSLRIRGMQGGFSKVLIDGIEMNDPTDVNNSFQVNQLDLNNIERIEILKGPQNIIYGTSSIGGVVNIVTKRRKQKEGSLIASAGSKNTQAVDVSYGGKEHDVFYDLSTSYFKTDGISAFNKERTLSAEEDSFERLNLGVKLEKDLSANSKVSYRGIFLNSDLDIDKTTSDVRFNDLSSYNQKVHNISYERKFFDNYLNTKFILKQSDLKRFTANPSFTIEGNEKKVSLINDFVLLDQHIVLLGAEYMRRESVDSYNYPREFWSESTDVYSTLNLNFNNLILDLGGRAITGPSYENEFIWKVGSSIEWPFKFVTKLNVGTGFNAPTLTQLTTGTPVNKNIEASTIKNYDFIVKKSFGDYLFLQLDLFVNNIQNQIIWNGSNYSNIGSSQVKGVEAQVELSLIKNLNLNLNYSYIESVDKISKIELPKTPSNSARASIDYLINSDLTSNVSWTYVGDRLDATPGAFPVTYLRMPSYQLLDLGLKYKNIGLKVENILDREYEETRNYGTRGRSFYINYKIKL